MAKKKTDEKKAPEKKKRPNVMVVKSEVRQLPVPLKPDELAERAQRLADCEANMREHEAHVEQVKKELKAKETAIVAERSRLAGIVKAQAEHRDVRVEHQTHLKEREYREVRLDSGEVVFCRPLRDEEMQLKMDLDKLDNVLASPVAHDPGNIDPRRGKVTSPRGDFPSDDE